jgi:catechol 2,3-dioxygenase-like lactoylglutathione lyase family enzyme
VLTPSEWEVLNLVRHGVSRRQIARLRGTSLDAVKYHLANIAGKLGVRSTELRHWPGYPATSPLAHRRRRPAMAATTAVHLGPIGQVSLSIRSVESAERFYRDTLGLPHLFTFGDLVFFDAGGTRIYLHRKDEADWTPGSILYFLVDDIEVANRALKEKGVRFSGAPHLIYTDDETGVEEWMAFFEDGEGNTLALMARVTPS